jgi:hypothetical protein
MLGTFRKARRAICVLGLGGICSGMIGKIIKIYKILFFGQYTSSCLLSARGVSLRKDICCDHGVSVATLNCRIQKNV